MVVLGDSVVRSALSHFIHNLNNYDDDSVDDALDHVQELVDAHAKMKAEAELEAEMEAELEAEMEAELEAEMEAELEAEMEAEMKAEKEGKGKGKKKVERGISNDVPLKIDVAADTKRLKSIVVDADRYFEDKVRSLELEKAVDERLMVMGKEAEKINAKFSDTNILMWWLETFPR